MDSDQNREWMTDLYILGYNYTNLGSSIIVIGGELEEVDRIGMELHVFTRGVIEDRVLNGLVGKLQVLIKADPDRVRKVDLENNRVVIEVNEQYPNIVDDVLGMMPALLRWWEIEFGCHIYTSKNTETLVPVLVAQDVRPSRVICTIDFPKELKLGSPTKATAELKSAASKLSSVSDIVLRNAEGAWQLTIYLRTHHSQQEIQRELEFLLQTLAFEAKGPVEDRTLRFALSA